MAVLKNSDKDIEIVALKFPDTVRMRPGKLVGDTNNPDVILREAIDNAKDEAFGSSMCTKIYIDLKHGRSGGYYVVADNGRGIPITIDKETGKTKADLAVSTLDAGSKFSKDSVDEISTGTHGVGVSCTNALSKEFILLSWINKDNYSKSIDEVKELYQDNKDNESFYYVYYQKGIKKEEGAYPKGTLIKKFGLDFPDGMHTIVAFKPDEIIFDDIVSSYSKKNLAYTKVVLDKFYNKKVEIVVDGKVIDDTFTPYKFEFIKKIEIKEEGKKPKSAVYYINFDVDSDLDKGEITGSVNSLIVDKGKHIDSAVTSYSRSLKDFFGITHNRLFDGLYLNVIVVSPEVDYSSQIKTRCTNVSRISPEEATRFLCPEFKKIFKANKEYFQNHVTKLNLLNEAVTKTSAMQKVRELVTTSSGGKQVRSKIPKGVIDCSSNDVKNNELFIVEGDSAGGTLIQARDAKHHAIIQLRGVPMNAINADLEQLMSNREMESIIKAYGGGVNELYNPDTVRYGKVIIAADADADGGRIASLMLGMFAKKITRSIEDGNIYVALSPLYIQGDKYIFPTDNIEKELNRNKPFTRVKGLGELNSHQTKKIFFDEDTRRLVKITLDRVDETLKLLTMSSARKEFMINMGVLKDRYNTGII